MQTYTIERFIEETNYAQSAQEVARLFGRAIKEYGYDRFCYSLITDHASLGLDESHGIAANYPDDWMSHYKANHYERKDPVLRYGVATLRPFTWDSIKHTRELKADEKRVLNEAKEVGLLDGIAIPIYGHNGELAGVGMASSIGGVRPDLGFLRKLQALTIQFHLAFTDLEKKDRPPRNVHLTSREKEILLWVAEGKSDATIAEIIGVSHATIRFHMNNIFRKLDANERTLATVKAIRQGLILPSSVTR
jgi:DNA-binding CsgD family transcriptional regulator